MRIARAEIVPYALPFRQPYVTARGKLERRELILLRLWTNEGMTGLGEAAPFSLRGGPDLKATLANLERCRPTLEGAEFSVEDAPRLLDACRASGLAAQATAAVDIALLDLAGKLREQPVWALLGASEARPVPCNATLVAGEPEAVAEQALAWAEHGFRTFKCKVGVERDVAAVAAVREAVGDVASIRVDANGVWSVEQAVAKLGEMDQLSLELAEQPAGTLAELAEVRKLVNMPVAADESVASAQDASRAVRLGACDFVTVKLAKVGGVAAAREVAALIPTYLSSALDGPVGIAAAAHLAQTIPQAELAHGLATAELFDELIASPFMRLSSAALKPSDTPGLGVEIDEGALYRCRLDR